jgi:putative transcriptional regulator
MPPPNEKPGMDDRSVEGESHRGKLLIAGAGLFDANFRRTVVLIGEHNDEGALGVVLNRPSPATVEEVVAPLAGIVGPHELVFVGGPVQPQSAVLLAQFEHPDSADLLVFDSIGFLMGDVEAAAIPQVRRARVFAGYAGWGPGQLEAELEEESWILETAFPEDVFSEDPEGLWSSVLRRKGGRFEMLALMPFDPSLN